MKIYKHLSQEQRYQIEVLLRAGESQSDIAFIIGCHRSTISRELKRNTRISGPGAKIYDAQFAEERVTRRRSEQYPNIRFTREMQLQIIPWLVEEGLSPELISQRGKQEFGDFVSHETIYQWIFKTKDSQRLADRPFKNLHKSLKCRGRRQKRGNYKNKRGLIPNRTPIENRPAIVQQRRRVGDLEVDLMWGKYSKTAILVIVDRATLFTRLQKVATKESSHIANSIIKMLKPHQHWIKTLTYDNDLAFAKHLLVNKALGSSSFFTRPYTSQDKGTVENRIGVLRRFFPKRADLREVDWRRVKQVEDFLNNRPVRKFGYQTPNAVFLKKHRVALAT